MARSRQSSGGTRDPRGMYGSVLVKTGVLLPFLGLTARKTVVRTGHLPGDYVGELNVTRPSKTTTCRADSTSTAIVMEATVSEFDVAEAREQAALLRDAAENQATFRGEASIPSARLDVSKAGVRFQRVAGGWRGNPPNAPLPLIRPHPSTLPHRPRRP